MTQQEHEQIIVDAYNSDVLAVQAGSELELAVKTLAPIYGIPLKKGCKNCISDAFLALCVELSGTSYKSKITKIDTSMAKFNEYELRLSDKFDRPIHTVRGRHTAEIEGEKILVPEEITRNSPAKILFAVWLKHPTAMKPWFTFEPKASEKVKKDKDKEKKSEPEVEPETESK